MKETLIIAGFGGQGVLSMGKILAYSGVMQDFEVTWMPSYGPEMRGGTANVTVILSDRKISSPIAYQYDTAIILNQQSMDKFEAKVRPGGTLIYDTNGITHHPHPHRHPYLYDQRRRGVGQAGEFEVVQHDDSGRIPESMSRGDARKRGARSEKVAARAGMEDAAREREGDPPRCRNHPAGTLTNPLWNASGRSDKERPDVVLAEDVCNRYFVVVRSSAVAGNGSPQRRGAVLLASAAWKISPPAAVGKRRYGMGYF